VTAAITITGLEDVLGEILQRLTVIEGRLDDLNGRGWFDVARAADYLATTPSAVRKAEAAGHIQATRSRSGRVLFSQRALDDYANGGR
jgi:hypothetical protein